MTQADQARQMCRVQAARQASAVGESSSTAFGDAVGFVDGCASVAHNVQERKLPQYSRQGPKVKGILSSGQHRSLYCVFS